MANQKETGRKVGPDQFTQPLKEGWSSKIIDGKLVRVCDLGAIFDGSDADRIPYIPVSAVVSTHRKSTSPRFSHDVKA